MTIKIHTDSIIVFSYHYNIVLSTRIILSWPIILYYTNKYILGSFIFLTIFTLRRGGTKQIKHKIDEQKMTLHVDAPFYKLYCIITPEGARWSTAIDTNYVKNNLLHTRINGFYRYTLDMPCTHCTYDIKYTSFSVNW